VLHRPLNSLPFEPVRHNPLAQKQVWFRKGDLPPFTQIARATLPPGETCPAHIHPDMTELFITLEGTALLTIAAVSHTLHPGDALLVEPGESHELTIPTSSPITVLVASWLPTPTPIQHGR
jgi:quercetin dioxygenase-like cupin family protein